MDKDFALHCLHFEPIWRNKNLDVFIPVHYQLVEAFLRDVFYIYPTRYHSFNALEFACDSR